MKKYGRKKPVKEIENNHILTKWQKLFLKTFADSELNELFRLSGGTALSAFYLEHRLSFDLDFFSSETIPFYMIDHFIKDLDFIDKSNRVKHYDRNIITIELHDRSLLKTEFTYYPLKSMASHEKVDGLYIDSFFDIAVNKLCAIADRFDIKDYVDIYSACRDKPDLLRIFLDKAEKKCEISGIHHILKYRLLQIPDGFEKLSLKSTIDQKEMELFFKLFVKKMVESEIIK